MNNSPALCNWDCSILPKINRLLFRIAVLFTLLSQYTRNLNNHILINLQCYHFSNFSSILSVNIFLICNKQNYLSINF